MGDGKSELFLLSCSGKLFIQLYPSSPSTAVMLLQLLDNTAGLTFAPVLACGYSAASEPFGACLYSSTVPQQGLSSAPPSLAVCSHKEAVDYLTILSLILLLSLVPPPCRSSPSAP